MPDPLEGHAACDRAIARLNDKLEARDAELRGLREKHALMRTAVEQLRPFEGELVAMRHRGDPTLTSMAALVMLVISTLDA